jgi:hypothetical protein
VVNIKNRYFWNVTLCCVVNICQCFRETLLHSSMLNIREIRVQSIIGTYLPRIYGIASQNTIILKIHLLKLWVLLLLS